MQFDKKVKNMKKILLNGIWNFALTENYETSPVFKNISGFKLFNKVDLPTPDIPHRAIVLFFI